MISKRFEPKSPGCGLSTKLKFNKLEARLIQLATAHEQTSKSTENAVQLATSNRKLLAEYATTPRYDALQAPLEGYARGFEFHGYLRSGFGLNERGDKAWFKTEVMIQAMLGGPEDFDQPTDLRVREGFAEAGNLLPGRWRSTQFWAGSRYYLRQDIHTLDYLFRDMSGIGRGILARSPKCCTTSSRSSKV